MNIYLLIILIILTSEYILNTFADILNISRIEPGLPEEFRDVYSEDKYLTSQNYLKEKTSFSLFKETVFFIIILTFILTGGFNLIDLVVRKFNFPQIPTGLAFAGIIALGLQVINIPFSIYHTFVIEKKYGFNKTTPKTFMTDLLKSWLIGAVIGGILFTIIIWAFSRLGNYAWIYCWVAVTLIQIVLIFLAPVIIMPLFNKFKPLENSGLKKAIEEYAKSQNFALKGIFEIDASKRSTKSNAFFTGFGKSRRIALFDTLIKNHTVDEIVSVLAHEIGHYKNRHIQKSIAIAVLNSGIMFFILSKFINNPGLFEAFKTSHLSIYAGIFFFGILYHPMNLIFSILANYISRKHEFQADKFAVETYRKPQEFISALKKLTAHNMGNLRPHPVKVILEYSHPPILKRISAIKRRWRIIAPTPDFSD